MEGRKNEDGEAGYRKLDKGKERWCRGMKEEAEETSKTRSGRRENKCKMER